MADENGTEGTEAQQQAAETATNDWETSEGKGGKQQVLAELAQARKDAREAKDLKAKLAEYEQRDMTEQQKLEKRATDAETAIPTLQAENNRLRVAIEKNLPADLVERLRGSTVEELSADADKLLALVGQQAAASFDGGTRTPAGKPQDMNDLIRGNWRR